MKKRMNEDGYLLLSTLLLLILSGIFLQSIMHIYANQIIQFKQFSSAYEYKTALNLGEIKLKEFVEHENENQPAEGVIRTSLGPIKVEKITDEISQLTIYSNTGEKYLKEIKYQKIEVEEEKNNELEDEEIENEKLEENLENKEIEDDKVKEEKEKEKNKVLESNEEEIEDIVDLEDEVEAKGEND